jgi:arsenate reductase (thioredoxin)
MISRMRVTLGLVVFLVCACAESPVTRSGPEPPPVLLVCEHGSVKSLMAASLFNEAATARGLPFRAVSRGVTPDERVPEKIAAALGQEGFDVQSFKPVRVSSEDLNNASRVVAISVDLSAFASGAKVPIERWDDVPAASVDYAAAHAALLRHVERLLDELQAAPR